MADVCHNPREYNQVLRHDLSELMDRIDVRSQQLRRHRSQGSINEAGGVFAVPNFKKELESVMLQTSRLRSELEKNHQMSSIRSLQDRMKETRQRFRRVEDEISAATAAGIQQEELLKRLKCPSTVLLNLHDELQKEKRLNVDLRKSSAELDRSLRLKQRVCTKLEESVQSWKETHVRAEIAQLLIEIDHQGG